VTLAVARAKLPGTLQLPSGRVLSLKGFDEGKRQGRRAGPSAPLYSELVALVDSGAVVLRAEAAQLDVRALSLCDFHALRAILTRLGWLEEAEVELTCRNCDRTILHRPCATLELGPFLDRELNHPELDAMRDLGVPHAIPEVRLGKRTAADVTLASLRVAVVMPLHDALARGPLHIGPDLVRAMGIAQLGDERSPHRIARALARSSDAAWDAITNHFLDAHYPPRLLSIARCPDCGARNDVDAPFDREFAYVDEPAAGGGQDAHPYRRRDGAASKTNGDVFPSFDAFDASAHAVAMRAFEEHGLRGLSFVVEGGVAACDDGGEPLLGAYTAPFAGDMTSPAHPPEVTVYYRTFAAIWDEDGPYDWQAELDETIAHELRHHLAYLEGDDPVDEAEHNEIDEEAAAVIGKRALAHKAAFALFSDLGDFLRRTWPIWLLLLVVSLVVVLGGR
jgi:hypothetical protein